MRSPIARDLTFSAVAIGLIVLVAYAGHLF